MKKYFQICLGYMALVSYNYILNKAANNESFYVFDVKKYVYFSSLLDDYNIIQETKKS